MNPGYELIEISIEGINGPDGIAKLALPGRNAPADCHQIGTTCPRTQRLPGASSDNGLLPPTGGPACELTEFRKASGTLDRRIDAHRPKERVLLKME
jgi:hypothetical protein